MKFDDRIECKTCGGKVKILRKKCAEVPGHAELIANCHGMWHVDIVPKKAKAARLLPFFKMAERMPKDMAEARRVYGPPPGKQGAPVVSIDVRHPNELEWIVDELDRDGGWIAQQSFTDEQRAEAHASQRRQDILTLKGWEA